MSGKTHPSSCTATPDSPLAAVLADILSRKMRMTIIRLKINPTSKKETINPFRNGKSINETVRLAGASSIKAIRTCKFTD
ncbi:MAG: hypothetical protein KIA09_24090 [Citrobacter freundii]|nr:hypothetical protein [Citrobacter freundii]